MKMLFSNNCDHSVVLTDDEFCISGPYENNISKHILLGEKLRKIKSKTLPEIKEYHVIDIMPHKKKHQAENYAKSSSKKKTPIRKPRKLRRSHKETCPLRAIELAYPSKRHCLETWKTRNKTLPIHMIDRLRKIINDENPKTPVGDAVNFYKRPKTKRRKNKVKIVNENNKRREQLKLLCGVFGYKIIEILEKPMQIELSPDSVKIAHIVDKDVSSILHNSEIQSVSEYDNEIQNDVVRKITVWIDGILEESSHKLFLEDLKDIEEEEGPVLDLLDEVFCKASVTFGSNYIDNYSGKYAEKYDNESVYHNDILQQLIDEEFKDSLNDTSSEFPEHYVDGNDASKGDGRSEEREWIKDTIFNAMDVMMNANAVNDNVNEQPESTDLEDIDLEDLKDYINVILIQIIEEAYAQYADKINDLQHKHEDKLNDDSPNNSDDSDVEFAEKFKRTKDSLVIRSTLDLVSKSQINLDNTVNRSEKDMSMETLDDGNKKVKFNNNDIDNSTELTKTMANHLNSENYLPILKTRSVIIHNENTPKTIYVSNPTPFLLSEADESWPESTSFHNTKSLLKVSKSVLSLGELLEREEEILPQSVRDSVEILNHLLSGYHEVATENSVSIPSILNNKDDRNTKQILENVDVTKDKSNRNANNMILEEASKIRARESKADNVLSANNSATNEEGRLKSSLLFPDKTITLVQTSNEKRKLFTIEKLPYINIVRDVCNEDTKVIAKSKETQHSPDLLIKCTQTEIETSGNVEKTIFETGSNTTEKMRNQEWTKSLDNIVVNLETWLYWIRNITADVERLLGNECGGVKYYKLRNKPNFDLKSWLQQSKDLHKRLVILKCKYNNLKVMPYKCYCNKNIQS
ncbi:GRIP and coiled-coil domain-containing protein PFC0235w-like isoform X3 [Aricia agestis]|uniref:GRIP and coiled-coil domain-containing protein PFC0235w-like isoform X3 n=1 Tax=Aricia agestis TaxID=91739 RepID=UPI001C20A693|nr:GRIP and coiled-coil domain-containing protein PFC0235w-like isoform X3 [Aricia agestis]